jgi:membrane protease YdiL (CAAX protease family)
VYKSVRRHPLLAYFALACAVSWMLWLPRIATEQGWWSRDIPEWWHYAGAAGPVSAAILVAATVDGRRGLAALWHQYRPSRARSGWLLFALGSLAVLLAAGLLVARVAEGEWPPYGDLAKTGNLPDLGLPLTLAIHIFTFGVGEETGWRGFALPRLQQTRAAMPATATLLVGWALWHVPSFFENPSFEDMSPVVFVGWFLGLGLGAVFLTWLYNSTSGSLLAVVLWHGVFNTIAASEAASGQIASVVTAGVMLLAVLVLALAGPSQLCGLSRRAGARVRWSDQLRAATTRVDGAARMPGVANRSGRS